MKKLSLILTIAMVVIYSCQKDSEKSSPVMSRLDGYVQKGPFISGSIVTIQELDEHFIPNGKVYNTLINDDFGSFAISSSISSPYVEIITQGYYFNEVSGNLTSSAITLRSLLKTTASEVKSNINILTTIAEDRIKYLVSNKGKSFEDAVEQAEQETLEVFGITDSIANHFYSMNMSETGNANAILIAVSSILQGEQSLVQLSEFISKFQIDFKEDGYIDNSYVKNTIILNSGNLNLVQIRENLENRYKSLGLNITLPNFEKYAKRLVKLSVLAVTPSENSLNESIFSTLSFTFNKPIDSTTISNLSFVIKNDNNEIVEGVYTYYKNQNKVLFTPTHNLQSLMQYYVIINSNLKSIDDQTLPSEKAWTFKTERLDIVSDLLMYLPFNGNANDESGNSNHATTVGVTLTNDRFGEASKAYQFNGNGNYIEFPRMISLSGTSWSYCIWFKLDKYPSIADDAWLLSNKTGDRYNDVYAYIDNLGDDIKAYLQTESKIYTNYKITVNQWYQMIITYDQSKITFYVNGNLVSSTNGIFTTSLVSSYIISSISSDGTGRIYGSVDDVRLYNRTLNASEVKFLNETESSSTQRSQEGDIIYRTATSKSFHKGA